MSDEGKRMMYNGPLLWQFPSEVRKNPGAHCAHAVPLLAAVQPELHVHWPFEPQTPFKQLHAVELLDTGTKQRPLPEIPSSHVWQPAGHAWHVGPKNPEAQDSHDEPVKPAGHVHVPDAEHMPAPAHGGEHAADWISRIDKLLSDAPEGSCATSGMEFHKIRRSEDDDPADTAAQTFEDRTTEPAAVDVEAREALFVGSAVNVDGPE
ncbi:hypothetical protein EIP86_005870 [Pleurotus ostreatoroseus]|nr:hypothetical protein EIP86_005870 [Pleurotus ostreatoroseus]